MKQCYLVPWAMLPTDPGGVPRLRLTDQEVAVPVLLAPGQENYRWAYEGWPADDTLALVTIWWQAADGAACDAWEALPNVQAVPEAWEPVPAVVAQGLRKLGPVPATFAAVLKTLPRRLRWHLQARD